MSALKDLTTSNCSEEEDLFFFESDHLALRGNTDYSELLKTLVILQSQRLQAIQNYEQVAQLQKTALENPVPFIDRLKKGEKMIPDMFKVVDVPSVNWDKYNVKPPRHLLKQLDMEYEDGDALNADKLKEKSIDTYNKAWSVEEQKRLEEFLIKYPPEPIEMNRFKKIAAALGTRTPAQVMTRVQKYFLKLAKLGLPIPGRVPKAVNDKFRKCHPHQRFNHLLIRPSTFFPELDIPVKMDDSVSAPGPSNDSLHVNYDSTDEKSSSNYLLANTMPYLEQQRNGGSHFPKIEQMSKEIETEIRLKLLKEIRDIKAAEEKCEERDLYRHFEYSCDYCDEEPIIGTRWHCYTCDNSESVDYCTDCIVSQILSSEPHDISHKFITIGAPNTTHSQTEIQVPIEPTEKVTYDDSESSDVDSYQFDMTDDDVGIAVTSHGLQNESDSGSCQGNFQPYVNEDGEEFKKEHMLEGSDEELDFRPFIKHEYLD